MNIRHEESHGNLKIQILFCSEPVKGLSIWPVEFCLFLKIDPFYLITWIREFDVMCSTKGFTEGYKVIRLNPMLAKDNAKWFNWDKTVRERNYGNGPKCFLANAFRVLKSWYVLVHSFSMIDKDIKVKSNKWSSWSQNSGTGHFLGGKSGHDEIVVYDLWILGIKIMLNKEPAKL